MPFMNKTNAVKLVSVQKQMYKTEYKFVCKLPQTEQKRQVGVWKTILQQDNRTSK